MPAEPEHLTHSLAEAQPGEALEILEILFEESRRRCAEAGLGVGTRARCRTRTEERVELVLNDGRWAEVAGDLAPFIEVHMLEPGGPVDLPRGTNIRRPLPLAHLPAMHQSSERSKLRRSWRTFELRNAKRIERQLGDGHTPCCPGCGALLEARPSSRLDRFLPLDASGFDLDCRDCRRFLCIVRHTARSLRLVRMRRLVAAVRAVGISGPARGAVAA
ncbi:hypothetical protein BH24GEM3_BH24GEM3_20230 [soil metagenome]|nr:hypothetical protein [Gemmatimonadota bacterium]